MNIEPQLLVALVSGAFSLGGIAMVAVSSRRESGLLWKAIGDQRRWNQDHEKEATSHRIELQKENVMLLVRLENASGFNREILNRLDRIEGILGHRRKVDEDAGGLV